MCLNFNSDGKIPFREDIITLPREGFYLGFELETADDFSFSKEFFYGDNPESALLIYDFFTNQFDRFGSVSSYTDVQNDLIVDIVGRNNSGILNDIMSISFYEIKKNSDGTNFIKKTYFLNK